jgi:hypothetical protein
MSEPLLGTAEDNLKQALQQEELMRQCGPGDPYYRVAMANRDWYLDAAARIERGEQTTDNPHAKRLVNINAHGDLSA